MGAQCLQLLTNIFAALKKHLHQKLVIIATSRSCFRRKTRLSLYRLKTLSSDESASQESLYYRIRRPQTYFTQSWRLVETHDLHRGIHGVFNLHLKLHLLSSYMTLQPSYGHHGVEDKEGLLIERYVGGERATLAEILFSFSFLCFIFLSYILYCYFLFYVIYFLFLFSSLFIYIFLLYWF